jgi:SPP1 family phage portal protein
MTLQEYINTFDNPLLWFKEEIDRPQHRKRISNVIMNKNYLKGNHEVLNREDAAYKGRELISRKTIIQYAKTVLDFHNTYMLGKPITLTGNENTVKTFNDIYKLGYYDAIDYKVLDRVHKFGDAYEVVYIQDGIIKSKVLDSADCYPVYTDLGEYVAFIEHWTDAISSISYWNVYYPTYVENWSNEGGEEHMYNSGINVCGLPIHYHNFNDEDYLFGESLLDDIKPLLDELEDIYSKLGDAVYVNSLNPLNVSTGVRLDSAIPADAAGYVLSLENGGDFKTVSTIMDYENIKFYIESLKTMINEIACIPAVLSNSEVSNISEMSMKMLFHLSTIKAMSNEKWLTMGIQERFEKWRKLLGMQGINANDFVGIEFNLNMPIDTKEKFENLEIMRNMGAISVQTIMEQSDMVKDASIEMARIKSEGNAFNNKQNSTGEDKDSKEKNRVE